MIQCNNLSLNPYILLGDNMSELELLKIINKDKKTNGNNKTYKIITKLMILGIIFLGILIFSKVSDESKITIYNKIFGSNFSFAAINKWYKQYLGEILPIKSLFKDPEPVFNEKLVYSSLNIYKDGVELKVEDQYLVPIYNDGIVTFVGEKEDYGKTVIIEQSDGIEVWYGNIKNLNIGIYDYVEKGSLLGESNGKYIYMVFKKDGKALDYKDYLK